MRSFIDEARRLHKLGCAIHWLRPKSKVPVKEGWSGDERDPIKTLVKEYKTGYNIGTKLGAPSKVRNGFLAVIDVDVKSEKDHHRKEALEKVRELFPGVLSKHPITMSGRGNGSMHIWFLAREPFEGKQVFASGEQVRVLMPSSKPSKYQLKVLSKKEIEEGWRLRPAFEIDLMCAGRQVALPPSIHPDSGKAYRWKRSFESVNDIPFLNIEDALTVAKAKAGRPKGSLKDKVEIEDVDELELEMRLSPKIVSMIFDGDEVEDRSAACLSISMSMIRAGFTQAQVLGVLTSEDNFIGSVAYEHAQTSNRNRAAHWALRYCFEKANSQASMASIFGNTIEEAPNLEPEEADAQKERMTKSTKVKADWKKNLDRTDKDKLRPTARNVVLILENDVAPDLLKFDLFSSYAFFNQPNPWGSVVGSKIQDIDCIKCRLWLSEKWSIEPTLKEVGNAFKAIAEKNAFHAVKEHLESLPAWDGEPRLSTWMKDYLNADAPEPYLTAISRKFLVAMIARVYEPGVKIDSMVVFEGEQGVGKSTVGRVLATDKWFLDQLPDLHDKDSSMVLQGNWLVEFGELSTIRRSDVETTKAFITRLVDKFRPPYGEFMVEIPRQCIFFGTTNKEAYLVDKTGNRRYWPIKVGDVDLEGLRAVRDQLFAEAMLAYDLGEQLFLSDKVIKSAKLIQEQKVEEDKQDVFDHLIGDWDESLKELKELKGQEVKTRLIELFDGLSQFPNLAPPLKDHKPTNYDLQLAAKSLRKFGWKSSTNNGRKYWKKYFLAEKR